MMFSFAHLEIYKHSNSWRRLPLGWPLPSSVPSPSPDAGLEPTDQSPDTPDLKGYCSMTCYGRVEPQLFCWENQNQTSRPLSHVRPDSRQQLFGEFRIHVSPYRHLAQAPTSARQRNLIFVLRWTIFLAIWSFTELKLSTTFELQLCNTNDC